MAVFHHVSDDGEDTGEGRGRAGGGEVASDKAE
jgi:hypothetical protein